MKFIYCISLSLLALLGGCSSFVNERRFIQTYDGPALAESESALLKPSADIVIHAIDGDKNKKFYAIRAFVSNIDADISFAPGRHIISVSYLAHTSNGVISSRGAIDLIFDAQVNRRYLLNAIQSPDMRTWVPQIVDVTNFPERWCLTVNGECIGGRFNPGPSKPINPTPGKNSN
ncbi:hypothetical protein [Pseudacidovorax sp. NFM-22]|uniref:hypothetical protein n=1 Tax=Pseudacidovorax sp. NFM-22 TaxID=2744469 RepID=UPI001F15A3A9|nr:hypothetical protein [Pseudacidovorax sp. NFM-22]